MHLDWCWARGKDGQERNYCYFWFDLFVELCCGASAKLERKESLYLSLMDCGHPAIYLWFEWPPVERYIFPTFCVPIEWARGGKGGWRFDRRRPWPARIFLRCTRPFSPLLFLQWMTAIFCQMSHAHLNTVSQTSGYRMAYWVRTRGSRPRHESPRFLFKALIGLWSLRFGHLVV